MEEINISVDHNKYIPHSVTTDHANERRWAERNSTCIQAMLHSEKAHAPCIISSISLHGMYLYTHSSVLKLFNDETQLKLEFTFELDGIEKHLFEHVSVVHADDLGIAITAVSLRKPALEDVFLHYTGKTMRDEDAPASDTPHGRMRRRGHH